MNIRERDGVNPRASGGWWGRIVISFFFSYDTRVSQEEEIESLRPALRFLLLYLQPLEYVYHACVSYTHIIYSFFSSSPSVFICSFVYLSSHKAPDWAVGIICNPRWNTRLRRSTVLSILFHILFFSLFLFLFSSWNEKKERRRKGKRDVKIKRNK